MADTGCYGASELAPLLERGVVMAAPHLVAIQRRVELSSIASGAVLHPFCRIEGDSRIGPGAVIGQGGPALVRDSWVGAGAVVGQLGPVSLVGCTLGPATVLGAGQAEEAVFLGKESQENSFTTGTGFRARKGTLFEEDASAAQHTDTKMAILFPWATLGSNINFCDGLLAGGTGPQLGAFSEVGSGAIHFNFTVRGDKATASLFGDAARGVWLNQRRLFLGGNGSFLGPLQAEFGAVTVAGGRYAGRLKAGLNAPAPLPGAAAAEGFSDAVYGSVHRLYASQLDYLGQLAALAAWYGQGRPLAMAQGGAAGLEAERVRLAGLAQVRVNMAERIKQLEGLVGLVERGIPLLEGQPGQAARLAQHRALAALWPQARPQLERLAAQGGAESPLPPALAGGLAQSRAQHGPHYTQVVRGLLDQARQAGQDWLAGVARRVAQGGLLERLPKL